MLSLKALKERCEELLKEWEDDTKISLQIYNERYVDMVLIEANDEIDDEKITLVFDYELNDK